MIENIVEARGVPAVAEFLRGIAEPGAMADTAGYSPDLSLEQKIQVLEALDVEARLELVLGWAKDVLADLELKDKIRTDVSEGMEKRQREFLLREQMSAIRKELGEDGDENVVEEYRKKIEDAGMPEDVQKEAAARARPPGADVRAIAGAGLDPHVPRLDDRDPVERAHGRQPGHRRGARRARRRPRGSSGREGPDPGVPGRP